MFNNPETYLVLFFFMSGYMLVDYGLTTANNEINTWLQRQKEIATYKQRKEARRDHTLTTKKVTTYHSKLTLSSRKCRHGICFLGREG